MLRDYQQKIHDDVLTAWNCGNRNVLAVAPTGAGKTVIKAHIARSAGVPTVMVAHRQELVGQISMSLAKLGKHHRIIASRNVVQEIINQHVRRCGDSFYTMGSDLVVAGVDTLIRLDASRERWFGRVQLWDIDEAHHVLPSNKWGRAVELFPNARGLGVTATPIRADRKSLGRITGGLFDEMIVGPSMRELINRGFLSEYRIFVPPQSIDRAKLDVSTTTGDFNATTLRNASHESTITGDIVRDYDRFAAGKRGITFVVDVETAREVAAAFNAAGVRAESVSANTPDRIRSEYLQRFESGEIRQLVNVDLFGEGMDVPAVEVVSMGRPTESYGLYVQQFGRAMRPLDGKSHAIIIDHVGNVVRHGLPDRERDWTLNDVERSRRARKADDEIPLTVCVDTQAGPGCMQPFEAFRSRCPWCGLKRETSGGGASRPEQVDGDLVELDPSILAAMRGEVAKIDGEPLIPFGASELVAASIRKNWRNRQEAQAGLRRAIADWAGVHRWRDGLDDSEINRLFFMRHRIDILSAQTLGAREAVELTARLTDG